MEQGLLLYFQIRYQFIRI